MRLRLAAAALGTLALTAVLSAPLRPQQPSLQQLLDRNGTDLPFNPQLASVSCPYERGPVKEGSDADRYKVSTTTVSASVYYLRGRPKPSTYPRNNRIAPYELHTYGVTAYLRQYKVESLFDPPHGQTGAAPNGIELHPVIGMTFH